MRPPPGEEPEGRAPDGPPTPSKTTSSSAHGHRARARAIPDRSRRPPGAPSARATASLGGPPAAATTRAPAAAAVCTSRVPRPPAAGLHEHAVARADPGGAGQQERRAAVGHQRGGGVQGEASGTAVMAAASTANPLRVAARAPGGADDARAGERRVERPAPTAATTPATPLPGTSGGVPVKGPGAPARKRVSAKVCHPRRPRRSPPARSRDRLGRLGVHQHLRDRRSGRCGRHAPQAASGVPRRAAGAVVVESHERDHLALVVLAVDRAGAPAVVVDRMADDAAGAISSSQTRRGKPKWATRSPCRWPISRRPTRKPNSPRGPGPASTPGQAVTSRGDAGGGGRRGGSCSWLLLSVGPPTRRR